MSDTPRRILIVDDNPDDRADMRRMLLCGSDLRYAFAEAELGVDALRQLRDSADNAFDCVLLDFHLPDMDALELLASLRHGEDDPQYPIIVLTGSERPAGTLLLRAGAQDYLGKDALTAASLTRAVENAIGRLDLLRDRTRAELALRESEVRYGNLFNSMDQGFCVIEMIRDQHDQPVDYRFLEVNPGFEKQSGISGAIGKRIREIAPQLENHWFALFDQVARTGKPVRVVNEARQLGGRWFDLYAMRLSDADNRQVSVLFTDITARKHIESALGAALAEAERANQAKSDFLSSMSHELRSPLNAILGFAQLIEIGSPLPTPVQKENIERIIKSGWYLLALINEILDLAQIESGKLSLSVEPVPLREVLVDCMDMLAQQAREKHVVVALADAQDEQRVMADRTRLKQVFLNLLSNAIKYNRQGGSVRVTIRPGLDQRVRIAFTDTGNGLCAGQIRRLFQSFERLGQENYGEQGTGIGLAVCKQLVELLGGSIGVESTVGVGCVFWVDLQAGDAAGMGGEPSAPAEFADVAAGGGTASTRTSGEIIT